MQEDTHFLIDNAAPCEVEYTLKSLDANHALSAEQLRHHLLVDWGYEAQRNYTNSVRRLVDLNLASRMKTPDGKPGYLLTERGRVLCAIGDVDHGLLAELMHYLHYDGYDVSSIKRKLLWSYRACCQIAWAKKRIPSDADMAAEVQALIEGLFPLAYAATRGGNFNKGAVSSGWKPWLVQLNPSPIGADGKGLVPRQLVRFELSILSLDHLYRHRRLRYRDPIILDDSTIDVLAQVFFMETSCYRSLIDAAARFSGVVRLSDTFAGTAVTLLEPYGIERI